MTRLCTAPTHGTLTAWRDGCRCDEARAVHIAANAAVNARSQAVTVLSASSYALPWDEAADRVLLSGSGTLTQRALSIGRTYWAARNRLARLRAQEANA